MNTRQTKVRITQAALGLGLVMWGSSTLAQPAHGDPQELFNSIDVDGSGSISYAEFSESNGDRFAMADSDGDGLISYEEMLANAPTPPSRERLAERIAERVTEEFAKLDTNGDGFVSSEEMSETAFLRMDDNGDGVLTADELRPPRHEGRRGGRRGRGNRGGGETATDS